MPANFPASARRGGTAATSKKLEEGEKCDLEKEIGVPELIEGCKRGNREAQKLFYERYKMLVFRIAARVVGKEDAEDISQNVFLKVFRSINQFAGNADIKTWLYRVAINESLQHTRRAKPPQCGRLHAEFVDKSAEGARSMQQREILQRAMALLPEDLRAIFVLREIEHLSYAVISQTLELPEGTVASRISRARTELRGHLSDLGWEF